MQVQQMLFASGFLSSSAFESGLQFRLQEEHPSEKANSNYRTSMVCTPLFLNADPQNQL
jgi:hypothetical protein